LQRKQEPEVCLLCTTHTPNQ